MARENSNFNDEDNSRQALNSYQSITVVEDKSSSSTAAAATKLHADASEVQVTSCTHVDICPSNTVSVATLIKGSCDDPVKTIACPLNLKTGLPVAMASNIPKNIPMLEVNAEKKLVEKLINLNGLSS